jgi:sugar/nucleoside kinase (ribokinase family)
VRVCAVGDLLLDVIVRLDAPIAGDTDTYGSTHAGAGGQAANVAAWAAALGGEGRFVGKRAGDAAGRIVAAELERRGVEVLGPEVEAGTGTVVSIATPDGARTMLSDRGVAPDLRAEEVDVRWFRDCDWLHLPVYSLVRRPLDEAGARAAGAARAQGGRLSVDLSSVAAIREFGVDALRRRLELLAPDVVLANEAEAELVRPEAPDVVVKLGPRGCVAGGREYAAAPAEAVDSTGAGDAFAAGYLLGGPEPALAAAARCVAQLGAMP